MINVLELARIADDVYLDHSKGSGGWHRITNRPANGGQTGFFGASYRKGNVMIIAFRGSEKKDFGRDWIVNDGAILSKAAPLPQIHEAENFTASVLTSAGHKTIVYILGHSLGGALAQVVAGHRGGLTGVTFNAPGMRDHMFNGHPKWGNAGHIVNLRAQKDPVSRFGKHIGKGPVAIRDSNAGGGHHPHVFHCHGGNPFVGFLHQVDAALHNAGDAVAQAGTNIMNTFKSHTMTSVLLDLSHDPIASRTPEQLLARH